MLTSIQFLETPLPIVRKVTSSSSGLTEVSGFSDLLLHSICFDMLSWPKFMKKV